MVHMRYATVHVITRCINLGSCENNYHMFFFRMASVKCFHCKTNFETSIEVFKHLFIDHFNEEMSVLRFAILKGRRGYQSVHYRIKPMDVDGGFEALQYDELTDRLTFRKRDASPSSHHSKARKVSCTPNRSCNNVLQQVNKFHVRAL